MASLALYPPIVENSMPAFVAKTDAVCRVYFSLSPFNNRKHFKNVQVSVVKQDSGLNVVNRINGNRFRATGIILNVPVHETEQENLWYIEILNEDIGYHNAMGWTPGWFYKIQIRLSNAIYEGDGTGQAAWLNNNSQSFSEWSTITLVKSIGEVEIKIPILSFNSTEKEDNVESASLAISTLNITGTYKNIDTSEILHSYRIKLYKDQELIEDSGILYSNQYINSNEFSYLCKNDLSDSTDIPYTLHFYYKTINEYESEEIVNFTVLQALIGENQVHALVFGEYEEKTPDGVKIKVEEPISVAREEEFGRVEIRFQGTQNGEIQPFSGNICIRRTDNKSNYKTWHDIGLMVVVNQMLSDIRFYDYTIESGVIYQYGVQTIDINGNRSSLNVTDKRVIRTFEYSYLLGENNQQLRLMFNNNMNNFKIMRTDVKLDTIGSEFPFISRNGATKYKTFPITGLISYNMDEDLFAPQTSLNVNSSAHTFLSGTFFEGKRSEEDNYTKERVFREAVLEFLQDGKPKLFKSPTEGNIVVRLVDVNCTPEQAIGRMVYSFSATAYEIAAPNMDNYLKYGFYTIPKYQTSFTTEEYKVGQLQGAFLSSDNICKLINDKYSTNNSVSDYIYKVHKIIGLKITIEDIPLRVKNNIGQTVVGNNILFNGKLITIYDTTRVYQFDEEVFLTPEDELFLLGDDEGIVGSVKATIDFVYEMGIALNTNKKQVASTRVIRGVGQVFKTFEPNESIYKDIAYKYYIEWEQDYRRLNNLWSLEIEANPGTIFKISDPIDGSSYDLHEINDTGILRFSELTHIGENNNGDIQYYGTRINGEIDRNVNADVIVNYLYYLLQGTYK